MALKRRDRDKRGGTRVKFNWSYIKRATLDGDITAESTIEYAIIVTLHTLD